MSEQGSDELMGEARMKHIQNQLDMEEAEMVEEERKTEAASTEPTPDDDEQRDEL
jgi:hypothetical protein